MRLRAAAGACRFALEVPIMDVLHSAIAHLVLNKALQLGHPYARKLGNSETREFTL